MQLFKNLTLSIFFLLPLGLVAQTHCCCNDGTCQTFVLGSINCSFSCLSEGLGAPGVDATDGCPGTACAGPLPISLVTFDAKPMEDGVALNWETASEINNEGFQIQRMSGINLTWEVIEFISGMGNSSRTEYYYFLDRTAPPGKNYYRLNQIDFDGTSSFSQVETASLRSDNKFSLWPTVTTSGVVIRAEYAKDQQVNIPLIVYDMMGRKVMEQSFEESIVLDVSSLMPGTYIVNMLVNTKIETLRFIKAE